MSVSVVVCHDRPIVREGLEKLLGAEAGIEVVGTTDTVADGLALAREQRPQVLLTSVTLNGMSVLELMEQLGRETLDPPPRSVVYGTIEDNDLLTAVLRSGVSAIVADDASREEVVVAVRIAAQGRAMLGPGVAERMLSWFRDGAPSVLPMPPVAIGSLTPREREILLLTAGGLSIEDIAGKLYIGVTTVRTHIYRVRCKLQVKDRAQLVSLAYQAGLL